MKSILFIVVQILAVNLTAFAQIRNISEIGTQTKSNISNIINIYTPVVNYEPCKNIIIVEDGTGYNAGDTVLLIQMKGAIIDSSNAATFGTITNLRNAGNYEFNYGWF